MELFKHQQRLLDQNPPRHLLAWGTGVGKTLTAIELAKKNCRTVLVICPKGLRTNWQRETFKHAFTFQILFVVVTKEEFRRDWDKIPRFDGLIVDEAHTFAGQQSLLHKNLLKYIKKHDITFRWLLTATPFLRNAWNIFALGKILGVPWNYGSFRSKFFYERYMGARSFWEARPGMEQEVAQLVQTLGSTVRLEDCIDIPDAVYETEYFKLSPQQLTAIKAIKEPLPIVRFTKQHQIAGGTLKGNEYEPSKIFECDKVARIRELAEENEKLIISCRYLEEMEILLHALVSLERDVRLLNGDTPDKQAVLDEFNADPRGILIVNAACSEGWQAPTAQLIVFYSYSFSLKDKTQMEGRIRRIDHPQKCTYLALVCEDSIDEAVVDALSGKQDFDAAIYNYKINEYVT